MMVGSQNGKRPGASDRVCSFKPSWKKNFPITSAADSSAFYCIPCKKTVSCSHQGEADVKRHCRTPTHLKFAMALKNQPKISAALPATTDGRNPDVIKAEVLMVNFIVQHNIPFAAADHLTKVKIL